MTILRAWFKNLGRARVLVVGDLMVDEYRRGHVERISPEAPVPILSVVGREVTLGGAGNVVKNLRSLQAAVQTVGVVGGDGTGEEILAELEKLGADGGGVVRDAGRMSTRKLRYVSMEHGQQVFRADEESTAAVSGEVEEQVVGMIREKAEWAQVILCSDYLKGVLTRKVLGAACDEGKRRGVPVIVAPKDSDASKYEGATVLVPNLKELEKLAGRSAEGSGLDGVAHELSARLGLEVLLVTRGSEGMTLFERAASHSGLRRVDISTVARNVYDVTGAGDTAIAAFAAAIAAGADRESAARLANVAAGIVVGKRGTATVTIEEIQAHLVEEERAKEVAGAPLKHSGNGTAPLRSASIKA